MKIKIGDEWFYPQTQPIMVVFDEEDKKRIRKMKMGDKNYAIAPEGYFKTPEEFNDWMDKS